eukprot:4671819-Pleurochrysis_carterae.AAC.1
MQFCQLPTKDNPAANPMPGDYGTGEAKMPACPPGLVGRIMDDAIDAGGTLHGTGVRRTDPQSAHIMRRTIYSLPSTTVPPDREAFTHSIYGNVARRHDTAKWGGPVEATARLPMYQSS